MFEKSLETGQPESIADTDDAADSSRPVHAAKKSDRALNFGHKVVEDRTHRLKDGFWIRSLRGVALQMLGLGKRQFHFTSQGAGEMVASDRHISNPDAAPVGNQHGRVVGTHVQHDLVVLLSRGLRSFRSATKTKHVIRKEIVQSQRCHLHEFDFASRLGERLHGVINEITLHGEQADLGLQHESAFFHTTAHRLVIPDDVIQVERDLLASLIADDLSHLAAFDRRQLDELRQRALPGNADGNQVPVNLVPLKKCLHRLADQLFRNRVRLTQNFGMSNVVEGHRKDLLTVLRTSQLDRLQARLPNVDAPRTFCFGHDLSPEHSDVSVMFRCVSAFVVAFTNACAGQTPCRQNALRLTAGMPPD